MIALMFMVSDGCLAHKTAVALSALSQYLRFLVSSTFSADHHLLSVNYLVEPYRLPQATTAPPTIPQSQHAEQLPASGNHGENWQIKDFERNPVYAEKVSRNPNDTKDLPGNAPADDVRLSDGSEEGEIDIAEERKFSEAKERIIAASNEERNRRQLIRGMEHQLARDIEHQQIAYSEEDRNVWKEWKKIVHDEKETKDNPRLVRGGGGESPPEKQQDVGDYDENTEVELDKDDFNLPQFRDFQRDADDEDSRRNDNIVATDPVGALIAAAAAAADKRTSHGGGVVGVGVGGGGSTTGSVRVLVRAHWFLSTVAVMLLLLWFRCMRCFRCGSLVRRCSLTL